MRDRKHFLKTVCPFRVLEQRVTWGEFIALYVKGLFGAILIYVYYIGFIALADIAGVVG